MRRPKLLGQVLSNIVHKPATVQFPKEKTEIEPDFRGAQYADLSKCTGVLSMLHRVSSRCYKDDLDTPGVRSAQN